MLRELGNIPSYDQLGDAFDDALEFHRIELLGANDNQQATAQVLERIAAGARRHCFELPCRHLVSEEAQCGEEPAEDCGITFGAARIIDAIEERASGLAENED